MSVRAESARDRVRLRNSPRLAAGLLLDSPVLNQREAMTLEDIDRLLDCRELCTNCASRGPELEQRQKPVQTIAESPPDENMAATTHDATETLYARRTIANVMPHM